MVDRPIVYPAEIPLDTHILYPAQSTMIGLGYALQACLGTGIYADGLACLPTLPASMQITVGPGSLTTMSTIDASPYGTLPADLDPLVKMGINPFGATTFTIAAPGVSGQSIAYLIEAQLVEADGQPVSLPYYNAAAPQQPFTGPNNSQAQQNTVRTQRVGLQLKAGSPAITGTQQAPPVDAGWVGLYVVTVNFAQTSITATSITTYQNAPFIGAKIPNLAPLFSPAFQGVPTAPTAPAGSADLTLANTAFISAASGIRGMQRFIANGTFVTPPGVFRILVKLWGAGGGGGGASAGGFGGGGGAGGYAESVLTVTPGTAYGVVVGVGGTAGSTAPTAGGNGGTSGILALAASGGSGGNPMAGAAFATGGAGGVGTGGTLITPGQNGGTGYQAGASTVTAVGGGVYGSMFTPPVVGSGSVNGANGVFPGGGAGGAAGTAIGGAGASGFVLIYW